MSLTVPPSPGLTTVVLVRCGLTLKGKSCGALLGRLDVGRGAALMVLRSAVDMDDDLPYLRFHPTDPTVAPEMDTHTRGEQKRQSGGRVDRFVEGAQWLVPRPDEPRPSEALMLPDSTTLSCHHHRSHLTLTRAAVEDAWAKYRASRTGEATILTITEST